MAVGAAVIGASGYAGAELVRLLARHPHVELRAVAGSSRAGEPLAGVFPHLRGLVGLTLEEALSPAVWEGVDFVFLALPSGASAELLPRVLSRALERGTRIIDLSGDLRLPAELYEAWYGRPAVDPAIRREAVYGLAELFPDRIRSARLVSNPGCYPTAILLGLAPLARAGLLASGAVVIDAKSGVSGAGRGVSLSTHFGEVNENFLPYKVGRHQHTPEVEHVLEQLAGRPVTVALTTHLLPVSRGILATIYVRPAGGDGAAGGPGAVPGPEDVHRLYREFYAGRPFVRVLEPGAFPAIKQVQGSNYCDIGLHVDGRSGWITVFAAIDNLVKGAAGQAVQNMNLMAGFDETAGLDLVPLYP
ncbi:MAG TPA: N-acetyl-gamma-glutamyl-phosphate reductase [Thermaerobacter sp.]